MTTAAVPMESLAQQIARQQSQLEALRQAYQARQARLAELKSRKEKLENEFRKLDAEIQAVNQGKLHGATPRPAKAVPARAMADATPGKTALPKTLSARLVQLVQQANNPVTVKQLTDEVVRRKFPTSSQNIPRLIQTRVRELVAKGILQHAKGRPGYVLAKTETNGPPSTGKPVTRTPKDKAPAVSPPKPYPRGENGASQKPLRLVLHDLLARSRRPLLARELAEQALGQGYRSESKNFVQVVWVALGNMKELENVPGKGYRLKKR